MHTYINIYICIHICDPSLVICTMCANVRTQSYLKDDVCSTRLPTMVGRHAGNWRLDWILGNGESASTQLDLEGKFFYSANSRSSDFRHVDVNCIGQRRSPFGGLRSLATVYQSQTRHLPNANSTERLFVHILSRRP